MTFSSNIPSCIRSTYGRGSQFVDSFLNRFPSNNKEPHIMSTPQSSDAVPVRSPSLVVRFGQRFGIEPAKMLDTLRATAFKTEKPASNEQMLALLVVAEQYNL